MTSTVYSVGRALRWSVTLSRKFMRVVPWLTLLAVVSSVLSQFFMLAGFLLPLKVVLLLGSETVPVYFPSVFQDVGRDGLVVFLSIASVCFYLTHLLTGKIVDISATSACKKLLNRSKKLAIFENQQEIASKGYARYSQNLATVGFVSLCLMVMAWFYPDIAIFIAIYITLCVLLVCIVASYSNSFHTKLSRELSSVSRLLGSLGFLLSFAYIVLNHLLGSPPGILVSVISLLLARQTFGRLATFAKDIQGLYGQKSQLRALFFHGHTFSQKPISRNQGFWPLVVPEARDAWIAEMLAEIVGSENFESDTQWFDIGLPDIVCYHVKVVTGDGRFEYVMKLFNSNRSAWAKHEATLLSSQRSLPSVPIIKLDLVKGVHCHIYDVTGLKRCGKKETIDQLVKFRTRLMSTTPQSDMVSLYARSHPMLWQRLDQQSIIRMRDLLDRLADSDAVEQFLIRLNDIKETLRFLPLALIAHDIRPGMLWKSDNGDCFLINWTRWSIEPIGAKLPVSVLYEPSFTEIIEDIASERTDISKIESHDIRLAALISEFEQRLQRARYAEAHALVSKILLAAKSA
ncbi:hypothetical protein [Franzmannia qiaohouensis]|uniref:Aminoglycoside phosphotransferase domain-containing protein n=1 Tax=Franzmannia qiaohouensis TaxID=1329370 RepID=A0ABU1HJ47_9GAMM|nr:hypothetical protein [Halomonas qiaohouensis]MDR5907498.1 hypothetical protein [Halomonas qiaohouensis]